MGLPHSSQGFFRDEETGGCRSCPGVGKRSDPNFPQLTNICSARGVCADEASARADEASSRARAAGRNAPAGSGSCGCDTACCRARGLGAGGSAACPGSECLPLKPTSAGVCTCNPHFSGAECEAGVCPAGAELLRNESSLLRACQLCGADSFKPSAGNEPCLTCPEGSVGAAD